MSDAPVPVGSIGGAPILGTSTAAWALTDGTRPYATTFDVMPGDLEKLTGSLKPLKLVLGRETFEGVYVVQEVAGDDPAVARVQVVDRRWFWTNDQMYYEYNKRRKVGIRRMSAANAPPLLEPIVPTIAYWPWSIKDQKTPWTAEDVLQDLVRRLQRSEKDATGGTWSARYEHRNLAELPIENLLAKGDLASVLANVLDYFPGVGCYVNAAGDVVFYDRTSGKEAQLLKALGPEKVGGGHVRSVDLSNVRPSKIRVKFFREIELRFDRNETAGATRTEDDLYLDNVLPVPDFSLAVTAADGSTFTVARDSWITFEQALAGWGNAPFIKGERPLTLADLRRACIPFNGIVEALGLLGVASADVNWMSRITAAVTHFRRTYRLNPRWIGRIYRLRASRVATLDSTTGSRGKAAVFTDWAYLGTSRSLFHDLRSGKDLSYCTSVPNFNGGTITEQMLASPFEVAIVDADQGILRVSPLTDEAQTYGMMFPSQIELNGDNTQPGSPSPHSGPSGDITDKRGRPIGFDILADSQKWVQLTANHKMALILTAMPALAGDTDPFHVVELKPTDVHSFPGQGKCNGPVLEILIGPGFETARVAWIDASASDIRAAFGIETSGHLSGTPSDKPSPLLPLTLNGGEGIPSGGGYQNQMGSLPRIAKAAAQRVWNRLCDRPFGSMTGTLVPGIAPTGWVSRVGYSIAAGSGEMSTAVAFPDLLEPLSLESYLDATTRRVVLQLAQPGA